MDNLCPPEPNLNVSALIVSCSVPFPAAPATSSQLTIQLQHETGEYKVEQLSGARAGLAQHPWYEYCTVQDHKYQPIRIPISSATALFPRTDGVPLQLLNWVLPYCDTASVMPWPCLPCVALCTYLIPQGRVQQVYAPPHTTRADPGCPAAATATTPA